MERKQEENEKFYQSSRKNDEILFKLKKSAARALLFIKDYIRSFRIALPSP